MISASQLGRGAIEATREQKSLGQDHIQGGISKINTSDLVIALVKDEAMDAQGIYRFEFLKSRNSNAVNKKLEMKWDAESLQISDGSGVISLSATMLKKDDKRPTRVKMNDVIPGQNRGDGLDDLIKGMPR
jgi:hypothetical protein